MCRFQWKMIQLLILLASANSCKAFDDLISHMKHQILSSKQFQTATDLPYTVAKQILHLDMAKYSSTNSAYSYETMMAYETKMHIDDDTAASPFVLCGSQRTAKFARSEISNYYSGRSSVMFASRETDVACWRALLRNDEAQKLATSSAFFHVSPIPAVAKFSSRLLSLDSDDNIQVHFQALMNGIRVQIDRSLSNGARVNLLDRWRDEKFGMISNDRLDYLYPMSDHASIHSWRSVRNAIESGVCVGVINPVLSEDTVLDGDHLLHVSFEKFTKEAVLEECMVVVLAYLANQNAVIRIEFIPGFTLHEIIPRPRLERVTKLWAVDDDEDVVVRPMNTISTTALQSGDESEPHPFWDHGINGTGQYVNVADTGFDDASCFLREAYSADYLTGSQNTDYQVTRSLYDSPTTDKSLRKIVQYVMRDSKNKYKKDYEAGHGSHVAGTIAGYIPDDGSILDPSDDYYSNCASFIDECDTSFAAGGSDEGLCDTTCDITPTEDYSGMAPGAKLMVNDFGDNDGALDVPSNMEVKVFGPAYDEDAHIFSNSWGAGAPYNYYDNQAVNIDEFMYNEDTTLVLFAAGNEGGIVDDDIYDSGDATIGAPAICKNVLTIGAAETAYTPDTVASFSSRGPTKDMRLKPEVCGPGDPVFSTKSSGYIGLASCKATSMSGTSMATPAVAGTAALIREILVEGKHQDFSSAGYGGSSYSESAPSGALLKALLIGSTVPLSYGYDSSGNSVTLSDFYSASSAVADSTAYALGTTGIDFTQGFGHVRLSNVFSLDGSFDTFCYEGSLAEYSTWTQTYVVSSASERLAITLVWTDPPAAEDCGQDYEDGSSTDTCLVHDLDLKVYNDGTRFFSNFGAGNGDYSGQEDTLNNAEKVTIETSDLTVGTIIMVTVETNGLSYADTQKFAVVVRGAIESKSPTSMPVPSPTTPNSYPQPTTKPIPEPTAQPISQPTTKPISEPTAQPVSQPTTKPISEPTAQPVLKPTFQPIAPNSEPTATPALVPHNPSLRPIPQPTQPTLILIPTPSPSMIPTTADTVTIITSFDLTSNDIPTSNDVTSLKSSIAEALNVSEASIKGFTLTYSGFRRVRRHLLTAYTWTANFDITVSLASTSYTKNSDYSSEVTAVLRSSSFASDVATGTGAALDTSSVSTVVSTRTPSPAPTSEEKTQKKSSNQNTIGAAELGFIAVGLVFILIGTVFFARWALSGPGVTTGDTTKNYEDFDQKVPTTKQSLEMSSPFGLTPSPLHDQGNHWPQEDPRKGALL